MVQTCVYKWNYMPILDWLNKFKNCVALSILSNQDSVILMVFLH